MATASLGKTVVYKPSGADPKVARIGGKVDTTQFQAGIITKIENPTSGIVNLTIFLDNGDDVHVSSVKNDDTSVAGHSWAYPA